MAGRLKEDDKNERIIRSLLKHPENKRCINCNSLGPQYVCTTFWTFVCTNCSGIHREFTHRVKSVSMAKFSSQEVSALQEGGNQRAKDIYFKGLDQQRQSVPDGSNVERLRDFIRHVYVNKRYTNEKNDDKPPRGQTGDYSETQSSSGSRSPPYELSNRSPGFEPGSKKFGDYKKSPSRPEILNDWRREDRFGGNKKSEEEGSNSPEQVKDLGSTSSSPPVVRPVREILADSVIPLRVGEPPKPHVNPPSAGGKSAASASSSSVTENPPEVKLQSALSLIDFDAEPSVLIQAPHRPAASATSDNWASFDVAPSVASLKPSGNTVDALLSQLAVTSSVPVQTSSGPVASVDIISQSPSLLPVHLGHSSEQPWNTAFASNVQRSASAPPSLRPLEGVPWQSSEVKPSGRTELPADLFTVTYPSYHAAVPGWQAGPPNYGMQQYNNTVPFQNPAKSMNPFDLSNEPPSQTQRETLFPSMASLQGALPSMGVMPSQGGHNHFSMPTHVPGNNPSAMPPRYIISPQIPGSVPPSNVSPIGNMGDTQQTFRNLGSPFAPAFPSGGNPFG